MLENEITKEDRFLIDKATDAIRKGYKKGWHSVGAALKTSGGQVFTSINFEATVGRIAVCAEPIALANAIMAGQENFDTIVGVLHPNYEIGRHNYEIGSPCGMCREIVTDYDPETKVIITVDGKLKKVLMMDLLPHKFKRNNGGIATNMSEYP